MKKIPLGQSVRDLKAGALDRLVETEVAKTKAADAAKTARLRALRVIMLRSTATILPLLMLTVTSAESEESSVRVGFAIATEVCASCHIASRNQTLIPLFPDAPKFEEIANRPGTSQESLIAFLGSAHGYGPASPSPTPQIQALPVLTDREKSGLASYILSLRNEH